MTQTLVPARVSSPGRILSRELEARGWTQKDLAEIMGRPHQTINGIIKGNKQITPETAIELAEALGTSAELWTNLEAKYRLHLAQKEANSSSRTSDIARKAHLYSMAPVAEMIKRGWINSADSLDELEQAICKFFEITHVEALPRITVNFRQADHQHPEAQAQLAWMKRVEMVIRNQPVAAFDRMKLEVAIPDILTFADQPEQVALVPDRLLAFGVHFAIVPHLSKTYLDGATFYVEERPVIALTLRYKRIDHFWFTLMHELGHVVAGHRGSYLDNMDSLEMNQEETEANRLAADWLLDAEALANFVKKTAPYFSAKQVQVFARSQGRHPGIVVGRLQRDQVIPYQNHQKFLVKVDQYLKDWISP